MRGFNQHDYNYRRRQKAASEGRCTRCWVNPAKPGRLTCDDCVAYSSKRLTRLAHIANAATDYCKALRHLEKVAHPHPGGRNYLEPDPSGQLMLEARNEVSRTVKALFRVVESPTMPVIRTELAQERTGVAE